MSEDQLHSHDQEAFSCTHVMDEGKPILYVFHDDDGSWQYLCGDNNHGDDDPDCIVMLCHGCLLKRDSSLRGVETLPIGHFAERNSENENVWMVHPNDQEPDNINPSGFATQIGSWFSLGKWRKK